jgi:hypothetical protein
MHQTGIKKADSITRPFFGSFSWKFFLQCHNHGDAFVPVFFFAVNPASSTNFARICAVRGD